MDDIEQRKNTLSNINIFPQNYWLIPYLFDGSFLLYLKKINILLKINIYLSKYFIEATFLEIEEDWIN